MNTHEALMEAIRKEPENHLHKLVLADFLDDAGEYREAEVFRWAVVQGFRPRDFRGKVEDRPFVWYEEPPEKYDHRTDPQSDLPTEIFNRLTRGRFRQRFNTYRDYDTLSEAWLDFCEAAQTAGWRATP